MVSKEQKRKTKNGSKKHIFTGNGYAVYFDNKAHGEDAYVSREIKGGIIDCVFDGISQNLGKIASPLTADALKKGTIRNIDDVVTLLHQAHNKLCQIEAGTTATVALTTQNQLYIVNSGDSPAYLIRNGKALQLTELHRVPGRPATLTHCVGCWDPLVLYKVQKELQPNDRLVLLTDGIDDNIYGHELVDVISKSKSPTEAVNGIYQLLQKKKKAGKGRDDVFGFFKNDDATAIVRYFG